MRTCSLWPRVLILMALLALFVVGMAGAQTAPVQPMPSTTEFLASLSVAPVGDALTPTPTLLATIYCSSNADCPTGQLCCYPCGIDGCSRVCMQPMRGHCPFFP